MYLICQIFIRLPEYCNLLEDKKTVTTQVDLRNLELDDKIIVFSLYKPVIK